MRSPLIDDEASFLTWAQGLGHGLIPRVKGLSAEEFHAEYEAHDRPVILENAACSWPAFGKWNPDYFAEAYGDANCEASLDLPDSGPVGEHGWRDHARWMTLREFVGLMRSSPRPAYLKQVPSQLLPNLRKDLRFPEIASVGSRPTYANLFLARPYISIFLRISLLKSSAGSRSCCLPRSSGNISHRIRKTCA